MKLVKTKLSLLVAILALTSFATSAALVREVSQQKNFERAARMSALTVVAIDNKDYATACKAQRDAVVSLANAKAKGADIYGQSVLNVKEICSKAGV
jgi:hypothetical protein